MVNCFVVIPLRESERLQGKAFLPFGQGTILDHVIGEWKKFGPDDIFISTSSQHIREACLANGYDCIDRDPALSTNRVKLIDVLKDAITRFPCKDNDVIVQVDVSCPLITCRQMGELVFSVCSGDSDSVFLRRKLEATLDGDEARCSQDRAERYQMWGSMRARTVKLIRETTDGWGRGKRHLNLDIVRPWEVDIHHIWDYYQALSCRGL